MVLREGEIEKCLSQKIELKCGYMLRWPFEAEAMIPALCVSATQPPHHSQPAGSRAQSDPTFSRTGRRD